MKIPTINDLVFCATCAYLLIDKLYDGSGETFRPLPLVINVKEGDFSLEKCFNCEESIQDD